MGAMFHYIAKFTISKFECKYIKYNVLKIPTDFFHISYSYSSIYNMDIHCCIRKECNGGKCNTKAKKPP